MLIFSGFFTSAGTASAQQAKSIYDFTMTSIEGKEMSMEVFKGKKLLIVNTASKCIYTPQLAQLEKLYQTYKEKNFVVVGFPSNDFAGQEPGSNEQIQSFCKENFGVTFPLMEKISVRGPKQHPIYRWLTNKKENGNRNSKMRWNFQKYLIDENGRLVAKLAPWRKPMSRKIVRWIKKNQK